MYFNGCLSHLFVNCIVLKRRFQITRNAWLDCNYPHWFVRYIFMLLCLARNVWWNYKKVLFSNNWSYFNAFCELGTLKRMFIYGYWLWMMIYLMTFPRKKIIRAILTYNIFLWQITFRSSQRIGQMSNRHSSKFSHSNCK